MMVQDLPEDTVSDDLADALRARFPAGRVRDEIVRSWRESIAKGLLPDRFTPDYDGHVDRTAVCIQASGPVLERLAADLATSDISVVVSDDRARIVARRVPNEQERHRLDAAALAPGYDWSVASLGTNAIGIASTKLVPVVVDGHEHFMCALTALTTASAPVTDPRTGRLVGAVTLVCSVRSANALLLPVARHAASEVVQRLPYGTSTRRRLLDEQFSRARRRTRGPLALVGTDTLLMNAAASRVLQLADQRRLWTEAREALRGGCRTTATLSTCDGSWLTASVEPVNDGSEVAGVLLRFRPLGRGDRESGRARPTLGWGSLTETELCLAELIAEGLTNKEAAARLFVSHHTVDSHLRHIFSKLDINSRVELARLVAKRTARVQDHAVA